MTTGVSICNPELRAGNKPVNNCDTNQHQQETHNVFRLLKFKKPHQQVGRPRLSQFITDKPVNNIIQECNYLPPLDCLRSIKFKLGWHYERKARRPAGTSDYLARSVNDEMRPPPSLSPTSSVSSEPVSDSDLSVDLKPCEPDL